MLVDIEFPTNIYAGIRGNPGNSLFPLSQLGSDLVPIVNNPNKGVITIKKVSDANLFTFDVAKDCLSQGGEVYNYPVFAAMTTTKFNGPVPEGIPGRSYTDDDGDEIIKTWSEWAVTDTPTLTNGKIGVPLQNRQEYIKGSEWITLDGVSGYELVDEATYRTLLPEAPEGE